MTLRRGIAHLLLFALLTPWSAQFMVYIEFKINQDYIAEFLCIEKDNPISVCNGNCNLQKELKKSTDDSNRDTPAAPVVKQEWLIALGQDRNMERSNIEPETTNEIISSLGNVLLGFGLRILRPPQR